MARELAGLLVNPIDGARPGVLRIEGGLIAAVNQTDEPLEAPLVFPGFVNLQVYDTGRCAENGVTGYLATVGTSPPGAVERFLAALPDDPCCLGAHVEGPYLPGLFWCRRFFWSVRRWSAAPRWVLHSPFRPETGVGIRRP